MLPLQPVLELTQLKTSLARASAVKKHHPDANPGDDGAEERFKNLQSAYTEALLVSSQRQRDQQAAASGSGHSSSGVRGGGSSSSSWNYGGNRMRQPPGGPRATPGGRVDPSRYNVREWERNHYGMHGGTAETRQAEFVRNMARQHRAQQQREAAAAAARRSKGGTSLGFVAAGFFGCYVVWRMTWHTNEGRFRSRR